MSTLALRPTFSESWYRVAPLKAKLRATAQISRQFYRGERWYVVRDPAGNQFHRLSDGAYKFIGLLDGSRTVAEAWELVGGQLDDDAPTQPEVIQILTQLYSANLMEANISPDAAVLLRRQKQLQKRQLQGRLMNLLFPRFGIWDPDQFLRRWMPVMEQILSKVGGIVWLGVVLTAIILIVPKGQDLREATGNAIDIKSHPENAFLLYGMFVLIKAVHELGHAFACRRFGGEVHELGIMFLVFIPTPYVDASTAWAFPSRWHRVFVGAAGMMFELFFASIMAFVWLNTYGSGGLISQLAFNAMLIASVSTIIFNANPLLRYDGYYMLSDWLEIPNLQQKSQEYLTGLFKRHIFRVRLQTPLPPPVQRAWMLTYAILSGIYRVIIGLTIILVVSTQVPVLGILMAIGGVVTWLVMPIIKMARYLLLDPELHRKRLRASVFVVTSTAAVVLIIGLIPFSVHYSAVGYLEPARRDVLNAQWSGFVKDIPVVDGQNVKRGQVIMVCEDDTLEAEIAGLSETMRGLRARRLQSLVSDPVQQQIDDIEIAAYQKKLDEALRKENELTIRAPIDGRLIAPKLKDMPDTYINRGTEIATVASLDVLEARAMIEQTDAQLAALSLDPAPQVRIAGRIDKVLTGSQMMLIPGAQEKLPNKSLGVQAGGDIQTLAQDPTRPLIDQFEVRVRIANPGDLFYPGQRVYIRFKLGRNEPLIWQWGRRFWQLVASHSHSKWT